MNLSALSKVSVKRRRVPIVGRAWLLAVAGIMLMVAAVGCYDTKSGEANIGGAIEFTLPAFTNTGSNAVQVFTEMHYQPSYRSQEEPRLLPPEGSVPISGAEITYASLDDYNAIPTVTGDTGLGQALYQINCQVCHGQSLDGNGPILNFSYSGDPPANLTDVLTVQSTDNELYAYISMGGRIGATMRLSGRESPSPMPEFRRMLSIQDRWDIVAYLRETIGNR